MRIIGQLKASIAFTSPRHGFSDARAPASIAVISVVFQIAARRHFSAGSRSFGTEFFKFHAAEAFCLKNPKMARREEAGSVEPGGYAKQIAFGFTFLRIASPTCPS
ncbi:hypothetical protein ACSBOB_31130 [Mesorhizobium sp. ASY16-5R]|uniref:hypothetical protein n=1 Tax=Mesorhizobium sp. ASY16-5R TaxID=3445772 RepID=UPI003F9ED69F